MTEIQTPPTRAPSVELTRATSWLRGNTVVIGGVALIAVSLWWKAILLSHSFFRFDDYIYLQRAFQSALTWKYLMWMDAGHLLPIGTAIAWFEVRLSPDDWTLASAGTLILLAGTCFALLRMLRTLFGDHPGILILLTVYLVSPLSLSGLSWWTATLELLPLQAALFLAVTAHVKYVKTEDRKHAIYAAVWVLAGMASSLRGVAVPLLLLALTSGFFTEGPWLRALRATLRQRWRLWLLYLALAGGYLVLYAVQLATSSVSPGRPGAFSGVFSFIVTQLRDTFIPGSLGGPWNWIGSGVGAAVDPPAALAHISWLVAAIIVAVSIFYRPRAWRAWAILASWLVAVDMLPVVLGRSSFVPGVLLGLVTRYVWDATGILSLCLGLAFLPLAGQVARHTQGSRYYRPLRTSAVCLFTAVVIGSLWSFYDYPTDPGAAAGRSYAATARIALEQAPSGTVIVDDPVPQDVTGGNIFGTVAASSLLRPLIDGDQAVKPRFISHPNGTFDHLMEFDGWGRLEPAGISGAANKAPTGDQACLPGHSGTVFVPLNTAVQHAQILRIGYLAGKGGQILIQFAGRTLLYPYRAGLHAAFLAVRGAGSSVTIEAVQGKLPCIGDVKVGVLLPSGNGPAIPPFAVNG